MSNDYHNGFSDGYRAATTGTRTPSDSLADLDWAGGVESIFWFFTKALWAAPILLAFTLPWGIVWGLFGLPAAYGLVHSFAPEWTKGAKKWVLWAGATAAIVGANLVVNGVWY